MTAAVFDVPPYVAANVARRRAAQTAALRCAYGCTDPARLYPAGAFCTEHAPQPVNPIPDPTRTLAGLRAAAGLAVDGTFAGTHTIHDQRAQDSGRSVPGWRRDAAREDSITDRFHAFHAANPAVMARLVELVEAHVNQGARRLGIGALFEELRGTVETTGRPYQLDNTLRAPYVRALIAHRPEWADLFELRQRRAS